jgi:carboxymethylenebutenolidase
MLHGINGPGPGNRRAAERFGDEGYVGMLVNWQSRDKDPPDSELMQYVQDAAVFLREQDYVDADRIGIAGYCRGGGLMFLALEHHPWLRAGLSFHGYAFYQELSDKKPRHPYDLADRIQAPLIMLHGAADDRSPIANMYRLAQRLEELGKEFKLTVYSGTGHAFTLPDGGAYNPAAAADSWERAINFLDQHLRA